MFMTMQWIGELQNKDNKVLQCCMKKPISVDDQELIGGLLGQTFIMWQLQKVLQLGLMNKCNGYL